MVAKAFYMSSNPNPSSLGEGGRHATITDVARQMGVSITTVWRAMNNKNRINPETRERILNCAKELGYSPSIIAQSLVRQSTQTIGLIVPMLGDTVYSVMVEAVEVVCREQGYNLILCTSHLSLALEKKSLEMLLRRKVEGMIVIPFSERKPNEYGHILDVEKRGVPLVVMELNIPGKEIPRVAVDNFISAKEATAHLIEQGRRRIAFFHTGLSRWDISSRERYRGFLSALKEGGIPVDTKIDFPVAARDMMDNGELRIEDIASVFRTAKPPDAIFATNDMCAIKSMSVLRKLNIRIPQDVAIVGFDDIVMSGFAYPALTTVRQPSEEVGSRAASYIFECLQAGRDPARTPLIEKIPGKLIVRESSLGPQEARLKH